MTVRAKFKVQSITRTISNQYRDGKSSMVEMQTIKLYPVSGGSEENKEFWASTPSGSIDLGCVNLAAAEQFVLDGEYYIDFIPAPTA